MCKCKIDDRDVGAEGRRHARPLNPRLSFPDRETTLLSQNLSFFKEKISFGFGSYFCDYIVGPGGKKISQLSTRVSLWCLGDLASDKRISTHISSSERSRAGTGDQIDKIDVGSSEMIKIFTNPTESWKINQKLKYPTCIYPTPYPGPPKLPNVSHQTSF